VGLFQGVNQHRLLPVGQELRVGRSLLFYQFIRLFQDVVLELQLPDVASNRFNLLLQFRTLMVRCWLLWRFMDAGASRPSSWFFQL
jgi:hypothetical protein